MPQRVEGIIEIEVPVETVYGSTIVALLTSGAALLLIGAGVLAFFLLRRAVSGGSEGEEGFVRRPSRTGKVAHDLGPSTWFGGTLFGQTSLNPAVSSIGDERERGRVLNEAWARFRAANLPAMLSTLLGWRLGGVRDDSELRAPGLTRVKDILLGGAAFNTVASAVLGASTAAQYSGGGYARPVGHQTLAADPARGGARLAAAALHR
jgi:hypothetical protein